MIAQCFTYFSGAMRTFEIWKDNLPMLLDEKNRRTELCHGLSSASKAFNSWFSQATIFECRRMCGGLGYSQWSMFPTLAQGNDINATWEGDNAVLL